MDGLAAEVEDLAAGVDGVTAGEEDTLAASILAVTALTAAAAASNVSGLDGLCCFFEDFGFDADAETVMSV